jgi:hypothetical protein
VTTLTFDRSRRPWGLQQPGCGSGGPGRGGGAGALDAGVTFFDTADSARPGRRFWARPWPAGDEAATKFGSTLGGEAAPAPRVAQACEDSLRRLGTDRIDLYQLHRPDEACPSPRRSAPTSWCRRARCSARNSNFGAARRRGRRCGCGSGGAAFTTAQNHFS